MACFTSKSAQFAQPYGNPKQESSITSIKHGTEPTQTTTLKKRQYHEKFTDNYHSGQNINSECFTGRSL